MEEISQEDLEQVAFIYDQVKSYIRSKDDSASSKLLSDDLETAVTTVMSEISSKICEDLSPQVLQLHILSYRYNLFKFCADKMLLIQDDQCCTIFNQVIFQLEKVLQQVFSLAFKSADRLSGLELDLKRAKKETEEVLQAAEDLAKTAAVS
jgi:hypothetical protein